MSLAAVTNPGEWEVSSEEVGHVTNPRKPKEWRRIQAKESSQSSEVVELETMSPGLEAAVRTVLKLSTLLPGWDGYRSPAIGTPAIAGALNVLGMMEGLTLPKPHVSPVAGGGVQIEWERAGKELELEFGRDGSLSYLATEPQGEEEGLLATEQRPKLWALLVWLSE